MILLLIMQNFLTYIKLADAGIFFIKPCFSKRFSCPTKFAEYLACGLPLVINAGIGDTDKIVKDHNLGVVIDKFNKESYLLHTYQLLELIKERKIVSDRCKKAAGEKFSLDIGVSRYFDAYRSLICN
jgi:glycosyltransferase involved in cell wall biosynthesis